MEATDRNPTQAREENDEPVGCVYVAPHHESHVREEVIFVWSCIVEEYRQMDNGDSSVFEDSPVSVGLRSSVDNCNNTVLGD